MVHIVLHWVTRSDLGAPTVASGWHSSMLCRVSRLAATRLNSLARGVQTIKSDIPWELRRPFQQVNRRRDDKHEERLLPAIPETLAPYVEAWVSSWERPAVRGGLVQLRSDVWAMPLRPDIVHRVVTWQRAGRRAVGHRVGRGRAGRGLVDHAQQPRWGLPVEDRAG